MSGKPPENNLPAYGCTQRHSRAIHRQCMKREVFHIGNLVLWSSFFRRCITSDVLTTRQSFIPLQLRRYSHLEWFRDLIDLIRDLPSLHTLEISSHQCLR